MAEYAKDNESSENQQEQVDLDEASMAESSSESPGVDAEELSYEDISYRETVEEDPKDAKIEDLEGQLLRARADFDNFRRRTRQEKEDLSQFATKKLLLDLLPTIDNFERAMTAAADTPSNELKTGIEMVHRQLVQVLSNHGVVSMEAVGEPFDPAKHDAVMQEEAEGKAAGTVIEELQKGYLLHDKVLRPAMVKVSV